MSLLSSCFALALLLWVGSAVAFSTRSVGHNQRTKALAASKQNEPSRRAFLHSAASVLLASSAAVWTTRPALADVSDGNQLPPGAAEFARVLKTKNDCLIVATRIKQSPDEIDEKEWSGIPQFLRRVYGCSEDMKSMEVGMAPDKKTTADGYIDELRKYAEAGGRVLATKRDEKAAIAVLVKCSTLIDSFLELLRDIPDEI